jgi:hypothetical protein
MPHHQLLTQLLAEYQLLDTKPPHELSADEHYGLRFYHAELARSSVVATSVRLYVSATKWAAACARLEAFVADQARLPRQNSRLLAGAIGQDERFLAEWVRTNRKAQRTGALSDFQTRRLSLVPGFSWDPKDERWAARFADYEQFVTSNRCSPSERAPSEPERSLARWATSQRSIYRGGRLSHQQARRLVALPIWTW